MCGWQPSFNVARRPQKHARAVQMAVSEIRSVNRLYMQHRSSLRRHSNVGFSASRSKFLADPRRTKSATSSQCGSGWYHSGSKRYFIRKTTGLAKHERRRSSDAFGGRSWVYSHRESFAVNEQQERTFWTRESRHLSIENEVM